MSRKPKMLPSRDEFPMSASEVEAASSIVAQNQDLNRRFDAVVSEARRRCGIPMEAPLELDLPNRLWKKVFNGEAPKSQS